MEYKSKYTPSSTEVEIKEEKNTNVIKRSETRMKEDVMFESFANITLMLDQVIKQLNAIEEKLSMPKTTMEPLTETQDIKRKIVLTRDASGKIIGADILEKPVEKLTEEKVDPAKETV
jgi:hypothetical protein